jgi:hypothetical protein
MNFRPALTFLILCCPILSYAQVNKCVINGQTVYQQQQCPSASSVATELVPSKSADAERLRNSEGAKRLAEATKRADELISAHCAGKNLLVPTIGMVEADVYCIRTLGAPDKINVTESAAGTSKQYVYGSGGRARYLYFRNGILTTTQTQQ